MELLAGEIERLRRKKTDPRTKETANRLRRRDGGATAYREGAVQPVGKRSRDHPVRVTVAPRFLRLPSGSDSGAAGLSGYFLRCTLNGVTVDALVDTGSSVSLIQPRLAEEVAGELVTDNRRRIALSSVTGDPIGLLGVTELSIDVGKGPFKQQFWVGRINDPCILGKDLLSRVGAIIDCARGSVLVTGLPIETHEERGKGPSRMHRAPLHPYQSGSPMERVAVDVLGPFPVTDSGNRYVLVAVDYFTKWPEAYAVPDQGAVTTAEVLVQEFFCRFGVPEELHSDQGRNFESEVMAGVCRILGIHKTRTTPLHPQSDGLVERFNRTLAAQLAMVTDKNQRDWDRHLPVVLLACRSAVQETTGFTPALLMFGRELRTPVTLAFGAPPGGSGEFLDTPAYVAGLLSALNSVHGLTRSNQSAAGQKQKRAYDMRCFGDPLMERSRVWLYNPQRKKGLCPKLQSAWHIPALSSLSAPQADHLFTQHREPPHTDKMLPALCTLFTALSCVSGVTVVTQKPPVLTATKGEKITMHCNLGTVTGSSARWYKQVPGGVPQDPSSSLSSLLNPPPLSPLFILHSVHHSADHTDNMLLTLCALLPALTWVSSQRVLTQTPSVQTDRSKTVTMDCNIAKYEGNSVYWYKQIPHSAPQFVLRQYTDGSTAQYGDNFPSSRFTAKTSSSIDYQLIISNVEAGDSAVYYYSAAPPPVLTIFPPSSEELKSNKATLVCLANDVSSGIADVRWLVDGKSVSSGVTTGSAEQQPNKKFRLSSYLTIEKSEWEKDTAIACEVSAASKATTKAIKKSECSD
ncbi:hypothetical protein NFI96_004225 [Prochilodus magdalenae]|nr:hypothetical protein NFI96_004225 [Prochilodus magdalenae]